MKVEKVSSPLPIKQISNEKVIYTETVMPGVWIIEPKVLKDARGYFMEVFKQAEFKEHIGKVQFVQDNESYSSRGVLQGLHHQLVPYSQPRLVRMIKGQVLNIAADMHEGSPTFDKYVAIELSGGNERQLLTPQGFARGFHVLSDETTFIYKVDNPCTSTHERGIHYNDPTVHIDWSITDPESINLSERDTKAPLLKGTELNFKY